MPIETKKVVRKKEAIEGKKVILLRIKLKKIKEKWAITSNLQLVTILVVFAVTGSLSAWVSQPLLDFIGLDKTAVSGWVFWPIKILIVFPIYPVLIVVIGTLFGQYAFFWNFAKKMLGRCGFNF